MDRNYPLFSPVMDEDAAEIIHKYAAWAASIAVARVAGKAAKTQNQEFNVEKGQQLLTNSEIRKFIFNPDLLPNSAEEFDFNHKKWREHLINDRNDGTSSPFLSHGIAAKLINVYLKTVLTCGGHHNHPKVRFIHPPVDSLLLGELHSKNINNRRKFWGAMKNARWSKLNSDEYEEIITEFRKVVDDKPLWTIEKYWRGHQ